MTNDHTTPLKPYGKGELAQMYFPDASPKWALRLFNRDLHSSPALMAQLRQRGWTPAMRFLRKELVRIIFEAIGKP